MLLVSNIDLAHVSVQTVFRLAKTFQSIKLHCDPIQSLSYLWNWRRHTHTLARTWLFSSTYNLQIGSQVTIYMVMHQTTIQKTRHTISWTVNTLNNNKSVWGSYTTQGRWPNYRNTRTAHPDLHNLVESSPTLLATQHICTCCVENIVLVKHVCYSYKSSYPQPVCVAKLSLPSIVAAAHKSTWQHCTFQK